MAKAGLWAVTDVEARKCGEQTGLDTLVVLSLTHLRAHETKANLVCRLLLEKKKYKLPTQRYIGTSSTSML